MATPSSSANESAASDRLASKVSPASRRSLRSRCIRRSIAGRSVLNMLLTSVGSRLEHMAERAGWVTVLVGQEHRADVDAIDDAVHHVSPALAVHRRAGVHVDRLLDQRHQ